MQIYVIPELNNLDASVSFSKCNALGWEFNDFMQPDVLGDQKETQRIIGQYRECEMPRFRSIHGAFMDILPHSYDVKIRSVAYERIGQSLAVANSLRCDRIVFHTNLVHNFISKSYIDNWLEKNAEYWMSTAGKNPDITILMENMFDMTPDAIAALAERMNGVSNFGVCLDYAHSIIFGKADKSGELFVRTLAPYVRHIHLNDCDLIHDLHLAVGDGQIDWDEFAELYGNYLSGVPILIEVNGIENQKRSLDYLSERMTRHGIAIG